MPVPAQKMTIEVPQVAEEAPENKMVLMQKKIDELVNRVEALEMRK
jgi:hypothetical protein